MNGCHLHPAIRAHVTRTRTQHRQCYGDQQQRRRDRRTTQFFAERAAAEYDVPHGEAEAAVGMLLGAIDAVLVHGGLSALAAAAR